MAVPLNLEGKSILLCEPEGMILLVLRQTFQHLGVRIIAQVQTGRDAIATALIHRPDTVLMDYLLPDMDAIEAARQILAVVPTCIIILSSIDDEATRQRAREAGVQGFLPKPFRQEDLTAYFQQACNPASE
jgi:two-component system, response regulator PdtaR